MIWTSIDIKKWFGHKLISKMFSTSVGIKPIRPCINKMIDATGSYTENLIVATLHSEDSSRISFDAVEKKKRRVQRLLKFAPQIWLIKHKFELIFMTAVAPCMKKAWHPLFLSMIHITCLAHTTINMPKRFANVSR